MKHSNFENELKEIRRSAINELKEALIAHGGKFDFTKIYPPCIKDEMVCNVVLSDKNVFVYTETTYFTQYEMTIEEILLITGCVPETDEVKDVRGVYPAPITWVGTDDIENAGFDASNLTQNDVSTISNIMAASYLNYGFSEDLRNACESYGLKEKED